MLSRLDYLTAKTVLQGNMLTSLDYLLFPTARAVPLVNMLIRMDSLVLAAAAVSKGDTLTRLDKKYVMNVSRESSPGGIEHSMHRLPGLLRR